MTKKANVETTAEAYLELLAARGIDYFFGNAGTDFAPIIEAYTRRRARGQLLPRPVTVPHEVPAVAMAHGYAMVTGRPQAVMVHVIVGTANALGGVINAARGGVPMLFTAGRNPTTEAGFRGSRERQIHWAQESFDQGAIVREFVKWDYELRNFAQLETVVDRALAITRAEPQAPVYLTLPREVLAERHDSFEYADPSRAPRPGDVVAAPEAIDEAARILAAAKNPVVITKALGRDPRAVEAMVKLAEVAALPVVDHFHTHVNFPQDHPLHAGYDSAPHLDAADALVVIESDAPWFPQLKSPRPDAKLVQIGVNEYDLDPRQACFRAPGTYFNGPASSSLGWGLGAALGAKLAAPDKTVICTVGDGAYIFGAPTAAHFVARAYDVPVLFIVFNNRAWNAVKRAVRDLAPDGSRATTGPMVLSDLEPAPDYELVCQASGGHAERVEDPAALPDALARALKVVREEKRQALLNVICKKP